jgi:hypothetical protein
MDADRQQQCRDNMKLSGTPTTCLDQAIVEGFMCQLDFARQKNGRDLATIRISARKAIAYATAILSSKINGASCYQVEAVAEAIRTRIGQPAAEKFCVSYIPKEMLDANALLGTSNADDLNDD